MTLNRALLPIVCLALCAVSDLNAQDATPAQREMVLAAVDSLFTSMSRRDTVASRAILLPGATFYYIVPGRAARSISDTAYLRSLAADTIGLKERIWGATVWVHGPIAQVWTRYDFHVDGKFSHCGVDSFSLMQTETGWRIAAATYTIERTGCPDTPLGPLPPP